jgi:hypothetical protein
MGTLVERSEVTAVEVSCSADSLNVVLPDGRAVSVPLAWFPRLLEATPKHRGKWSVGIIGGSCRTKMFQLPVGSSTRIM